MKGLIFTYVLTYGGALVAVFNPYVGLLIYICFAIIKPEAMWHWSVPIGNYSRIVAIGLLLGWLLNGLGNWSFGRAKPIVLALIAYLAWAALGAFLAPNKAAAWDFVEALTKIVLPFLVGITMIDSVAKLKQLAWVIALSHGYLAFELNLTYLNVYNQVYFDGYGGMDNNCVAITMVTCVGLAFFLGLSAQTLLGKGLGFASALLIAHVVMFSFSRGGMLALIITALVTFWLIPKKFSYYVIFLLAILVGFRLSGREVTDRFLTIFASAKERDESAQSRLDLWKDCLDSMSKHPVFGVGPDHWRFTVEKYGHPQGKLAHTLWLQVGAELGIPGLLALVLFYWLTIRRLWPLARERVTVSDPWLLGAARMVIAAIIGFAVAAQFVSLVGLETPFYVTLIGAGILKLISQPAFAANPVPVHRFDPASRLVPARS
jgi:O-antigen ligase